MPEGVYGNPEVIQLLESYLELAKEQPYGSVAISMVARPNLSAADFVGEISLEFLQLESLQKLRDRVALSVDDWMVPTQDLSLDPSYVVYNVANGPLGFDFIIWLVTAEMYRIATKAPGPLKVGFWLGKDSARRINQDERDKWLKNVFRPALNFIGAVEDPKAINGHYHQTFTPLNIVNLFKKGTPTPIFKSKKEWDLPRDMLTITLREAKHHPDRNSQLEEWIKFAKTLDEPVLFIRDTAKAYERIDGFEICPIASIDLDARMWIYNNAKANLYSSNGPAGLALFNEKPWLQFIRPDEDAPFALNSMKFWHDNQGIELGEQYPWCRPDQRIVWSSDTCDNITSAYAQLKGLLNG